MTFALVRTERFASSGVHGDPPVAADLSICVPAYNRPGEIERTLRSVMASAEGLESRVHLVIADDSSDPSVREVCERLLADWIGDWRYEHHSTRLGLVANFNRCVELAVGRHVLILHDDDYLLPTAIEEVLGTLSARPEQNRVVLFGVQIVDADGRQLRRKGSSRDHYLGPEAALRRVLSDSSFIRFPAIVVRRDAYEDVGPFDPGLGNPTDLDMWIRLLSRFGLLCAAATVAAYSVHESALTSGMFDAATVAAIARIFDRASATRILDDRAVRRCEADWYHQFILAGAYRRLRSGDVGGTRETLELFNLPVVRDLGPSPRWVPVRIGLTVSARLPVPVASRLGRVVGRLRSLRSGG